jgi:hypothetical protein
MVWCVSSQIAETQPFNLRSVVLPGECMGMGADLYAHSLLDCDLYSVDFGKGRPVYCQMEVVPPMSSACYLLPAPPSMGGGALVKVSLLSKLLDELIGGGGKHGGDPFGAVQK